MGETHERAKSLHNKKHPGLTTKKVFVAFFKASLSFCMCVPDYHIGSMTGYSRRSEVFPLVFGSFHSLGQESFALVSHTVDSAVITLIIVAAYLATALCYVMLQQCCDAHIYQ